MEKIKLGLAGVGMAWEKLHYPAFARLMDKYEITAVCDKDLSKAAAAKTKLNLPQNAIYSDLEKMLGSADIEAVDLMLPIHENFEAAKVVISKKKHLIAEKPFSSTEDGAKQLIKLANKNKVKVMVAENVRYDEETAIIKNIIDEKKIGNVVYFIDNNITEFQKDMLGDSFASAEWRQHPEYRGGVLLDSAIHRIAMLRYLFGDVTNLYATGRPSEADFSPYSCVNALLMFKDHISGHFAYYMIGKETQAPLVGLRIFGTNGEIYLEDKCCGFVNVSYKSGHRELIPYKANEGYYNELVNFYNAVRQDEKIISTPDKELGDIQVIFDILDHISKA